MNETMAPKYLTTTYRKVSSKVPAATRPLKELVEVWHRNTPVWIEKLTDPRVDAGELKMSQALSTLCASFDGARRGDFVTGRNPWVLLDVDDDATKMMPSDYTAIHATFALAYQLARNEHIVLAAPSFRGFGLRVLVKVDPWQTSEEYYAAWLAAETRMSGWLKRKGLLLVVDQAAKDFNRGTFPCLVGHETIVRYDATPLSWTLPMPSSMPPAGTVDYSRWSIERGLHTVMSLPQSFADNRDDWLTVLCAVKAEYGEDGVGIARQFSQRSSKYGSDTAFDRDWRSLSPEGGRTGRSMTWFERECGIRWSPETIKPVDHALLRSAPTPNVASAASNDAKTAGKPSEEVSVPTEAGVWHPLDADDWVVLADLVPTLGLFHGDAVRCAVSPTAALFMVVSTVGLAMPHDPLEGVHESPIPRPQRLSSVGGYYGNPPQPLCSYLVVLGGPASGKTRAARYGLPARDVALVNAPPSGQALAQSVLNACRVVKTDDEVDGHELRSPNFLVHYDEATVFDAYMAGQHGGGLKGALSSVFFGDPKLISQAAATQDANRPYPKGGQHVNVSVVINAQPGTCEQLASDTTGLAARFLWCAPRGSEYVLQAAPPETAAVPFYKKWVPKYDRPYSINFDGLANREILLASQLTALIDEQGSEAYQTIERELSDEFGAAAVDWWVKHGAQHGVAKTVRVAAAITVIAGDDNVTKDHLLAAKLLVAYSDRVRDGYAEWIKQERIDAAIDEQTERRGAMNASQTVWGERADELIERAGNAILRKLERTNNTVLTVTEINNIFNGRQRRELAQASVKVGDAIEQAVTHGRLSRVEGGFRLPTKQDAVTRPHTTA